LAGGADRRAASGPSFGPRRRFLFALARLSFLSMIGGAERIEVKSAVIGDHPQVIIAPPDHPLAKQRSISPREIAKQTILMREVGSGTRLLAERFLAKHGIEPRIGMEIGSNETIKQAVMAGLGIALSLHTQLRLRLATAGWLFSTSPACQRSGSGSWCIQRRNE
jgi:DNA-binding transcriptional LysR family regulator